MPYLTDLAQAVRKSGLRVVECGSWTGRGHGPMTSVKGVVCHWTATGPAVRPGEDYPSLGIVRDGRAGLPGPLANLGLGRDGTVYVIAAGLAYHAGEGYLAGVGANGNANLVGIECEGSGTWPAAQLAAYPRLCAALSAHYRFPAARVIGHSEWTSRKIDINTWPGGMARFRAQVGAPPTPPPPQEDGFLSALSSSEQRALFNRVFGFCRQRWFVTGPNGPREVAEGTKGATPATALDTLDGNYLVERIAAAEAAAEAGATIDHARLAAELIARGGLKVEIDYAALAKAVNDDAARRMVG
ncbi:Phage endolysin [Actinokineospora spheciospongiae]|uniref:N-acetylmuramoyl-L-alanine amidase n=1 Tax=Actinokineospora spheciospongiae TaxID=909613 RepID=W7J3Y6_9PSEU|nr:N-acetylmuramoyl-L-alanine amidase [Actinokineospora spheciospongiae]EWC63691.1 Phage endolysin [Actinokineospora spheciospongiae]